MQSKGFPVTTVSPGAHIFRPVVNLIRRVAASSRAFTLAAAAAVVLAPSVAPAMTADELFADGNRLFREDLYFAALLRYREAAEAGMDTPLLHYNMGVAHYKAQQYERARAALLRATTSRRLQAHANYNLGLTAWAAGDRDEALNRFRLARDQERYPQISRLAEKAIAEIRQELAAERAPIVARAREGRHEPKPLGTLDLYAHVSGATDTNVFRSPSASYVDQSDPTLPVIDPVVQSGFFLPVNLGAKYSINTFENESFFGAYRFAGRFYQDQNLKNGDAYTHEVSIGSEYDRRTEDRQTRIFSAFTVAQRDETYYDRDTGGTQTVNNVPIDERLNYIRYGPEIWFRRSYERFSFGGHGKAQLWNYQNTEVIPEYDHEYMLVGLNAQFRFTRTSLLRMTADAYKRHFGSRPSYELDGTQPIGNEPVKYDYLEFGLTARQRITRNMWFGIDYIRTDRQDLHAGYNNYARNSFGTEFHLKMGDRFNFEAVGVYQVYDYENAFAFQNPAAGRKTLERTLGSASATFLMTRQLSLVAEVRYDDVMSNDTRLAYNRMQYMLGVRWDRWSPSR